MPDTAACPKCGSVLVGEGRSDGYRGNVPVYVCADCGHERTMSSPPDHLTEFVRCACATARCDAVGVGTTWDDARKALWLDHAKEAGHAIPD